MNTSQPVLILGAGINGAALARELVLNRVPVVVVDTADVAYGATAYSSRLIHGGLRYLEYGEFDLVRESLGERNRLLLLAPHLVRPLRLFIPVRRRTGGVIESLRRFIGWERTRRPGAPAPERGLWLVKLGLWFYDSYSRLAATRQQGWQRRDAGIRSRKTYRVGAAGTPRVDPGRYRWLCAYSDAQVRFPERFTLALLEDARRIAAAGGVQFEVLTYHRATLVDGEVRIDDETDRGRPGGRPPTHLEGQTRTLRPAAIVNATGAWVDFTLQALKVPARTMMGGTKGSHFLTHHAGLRAALDGEAIYAEAADGRPVFILPFDDATLVGTTDLPFRERPETAVASDAELAYLLETVNTIVAGVHLTRGDVAWHYSGVRPLPAVDARAPSAITRRHWLEEHRAAPLPCYSVIGGKLTTCRSLAEEASATILARLGRPVLANSRERPLPGGEEYPLDEAALQAEWRALAEQSGLAGDQIMAMWRLCGGQVREIVERRTFGDGENLCGTKLPLEFCRWSIEREWAARLDDLVERRLMLLYEPGLSVETLRQLAGLLVDAERLAADEVDAEVARVGARLASHFGRRVLPAS